MKFKDLVTETGFLTPEGEKALSYMEIMVIGFFSRVDEEKLTEQQVMTAQAAFMKKMSDLLSKERNRCSEKAVQK